MRVIFLDIDGVLNNWEGLSEYGIHYIDAEKVSLLKSIVYATDAKIVLSSTWRIKSEDFAMVKAVLLSQGMEIYDITPSLMSGTRGNEIRVWLGQTALPVDKYAILDDDVSAGYDGDSVDPGYFQTYMEVGLTIKIAQDVIKYLKG